MSVFHNNALIGAGGGAVAADAAVATKSLRFNRDDDAMLTRTLSSGNRKKWTWSAWIKRVQLGSQSFLFQGEHTTGHGSIIEFNSADQLDVYDYVSSYNYRVTTTRNLRDPSAWYHIVVAFDSAQSTAADRVKIYINGGSAETDFANSSYPSQNSEHYMNSAVRHIVGRATFNNSFGSNATSNVYLADVYFIDGSALDPTSFGAYDDSGVWQAAAYSGTYGTNGFHLAFGDSSTDAALGTDSSGNDNTFTVNNLSTAPGLATANQGFDCVTWSGNGGTQSISGLNFQPDLVWFKGRSGTAGVGNHRMFDVVRGVQKQILPNLTNAEGTDSNTLTAFNSNGFSVGSSDAVNGSGTNYVAWCWKAGGSPSSNTDGTITSSVSANDTYGFSVVGWEGNGSSSATVGHGLSSTPKWVIVKGRETTDSWSVHHSGLTSGHVLLLNSTGASFTASTAGGGGVGAPTSSTLTFISGTSSVNNVNQSTKDFIAYCWSEVSGFSKFGSYTGNGSTDGPTVTLGFKPRFILLRSTSASRAWCIYDTERDTSTTNDNNLFANNNSAESSDSSHNITILDNGFKLATTSVNRNGNGETYVYAAFADKPNGADNDSLFDVPTNGTQSDTGAGGEVSGNYCCLNPLHTTAINGGSGAAVLSNGNLEATSNTSAYKNNFGTIVFPASGKYYFEVTVLSNNGTNNQTAGIAATTGTAKKYLLDCFATSSTSKRSLVDSSATSLSGSFNVGDVIGVAVDCDAGTAVIKHNNTDIDSGYTLDSSLTYAPFFSGYNCGTSAFNFGQRAWVYSAPSNHKALCTTNLPTPTIADGSDYFDISLWTGTGSSRSITGLSFSPDWVWIKPRNAAYNNALFDTVRGSGKRIKSNDTVAEDTDNNTLSGFNSDGFSLGTNNGVNQSSKTYVAWNWDAGSSTASNTDGSITSSVRANASAGFSIVSYTGNFGNKTVGHGLNAAPEMIIIKCRSNADGWPVYHASLGNTNYVRLESTAGQVSTSPVFNSTSPTSSVFTIGQTGLVNETGRTYIAYCFAPVAGYSAIGSYEGNGSNDGVFIHTGFRVGWVLIKSTTESTRNWVIFDTARDALNTNEARLSPNTSGAELTQGSIDFLSNGFKLRNGTNPGAEEMNKSGQTYIYYAIAENPFQANGGLAR